MAIADLRREYNFAGLRRSDLDNDPIVQFQKWFEQAAGKRTSGRVRRFLIRSYKALLQIAGAEPMDVNAATLATADKAGRPSARIVLLKGVDARGFIFYTNYGSRKGRELEENPNAALTFYWPEQERQVCVAGPVVKLSREESEAYFRSRPKGSRLGAWASHQSEPVQDREVLEERLKDLEKQYPGNDVPMPPYWGGFLIAPTRVEFWQGRPSRLHDRFCYAKQGDGTWKIERLSP
ncbi:MAG TPA: pyridoxamine 5'-phosphate oxidase [Candidatus Paceibacterota bacterium]|nr:pyridoxamine 5'-phosphate oxidase [Candidatus Paceibacterota bacterium]